MTTTSDDATPVKPAKRYICTAAAPWTEAIGGRAAHPDAVDDGECSDGCCDFFRCPHCGVRFRVELPQ